MRSGLLVGQASEILAICFVLPPFCGSHGPSILVLWTNEVRGYGKAEKITPGVQQTPPPTNRHHHPPHYSCFHSVGKEAVVYRLSPTPPQNHYYVLGGRILGLPRHLLVYYTAACFTRKHYAKLGNRLFYLPARRRTLPFIHFPPMEEYR